MTPLPAAAAAFVATHAAWRLALQAAQHRGASIGTLPLVLPAAVAAIAAIACARDGFDVRAIIVVAMAAVAAVTDARSGAIFDRLTLALVAIALLTAVADGDALAALAGAVAAGGALFALHAATRGRGIGLGDVKLAAGIGAGLGAPLGILALAAAFVAGGVYGAWLLATKRARRDEAVRFGPFVAAGTAFAVLLPGTLR
jgi:leader peptidase (prepilin peptidase)/N-methyltransferase